MPRSPLGCDEVELLVWVAARSKAVTESVEALLERVAVTEAQRRLLATASIELRARSERLEPAVHLPLLVHEAIRGTDAPALPLATATSLLELGIDLLDHVADRELGPHWAGVPPAHVQLAATGLLCCLPQRALLELDVPADRGLALQRLLADGMARIGAGQQRDLELFGVVAPELAELDAAIAGKTGERRALYAQLAASAAGAANAACESFAAMGRAFGIARQLASDARDLAGEGRDLRAGLRTWPVAWWIARTLEPPARSEALELVERAGRDGCARAALTRRLHDEGAMLRTAVEIELHLERARGALARAQPLEPAASALRRWIDATSFMSE